MTTSADPVTLLRSRAYVQSQSLAFAAILGVPVSAAVYRFPALASYLKNEVYVHLPHGLGFATAPAWWPLVLVGAVLAAVGHFARPTEGGPDPHSADRRVMADFDRF